MADPRQIALAPVTAGLSLARKALAIAPMAARSIVGLVRRPARESGWPAEPAVKVDAPVRPRHEPVKPEPARPAVERTPDLEAVVAEVVDPHIEEEEPELVATIAESGAEDGAGPQLEVAEPWEGYRQMTAAAVLERLEGASAEEAAAIKLYEGTSKRRHTVLEAAGRRLEVVTRS